MYENTRRGAAFLAARHISRTRAISIYSYSAGKFTFIDGDTRQIFDYDSAGFIDGANGSYYDYRRNAFFDLSIKGANFDGFDYGTGHFFEGRVIGSSVELF